MPQEHLLILGFLQVLQFKSAFAAATNEASVLTGSLVDNSKIYHSDANYNLKT
jgi:hypothetical protein